MRMMLIFAVVVAFFQPPVARANEVFGEMDQLAIVYTPGYAGSIAVNGRHLLTIPPSVEASESQFDPFKVGYRYYTRTLAVADAGGALETFHIIEIVPAAVAPFQEGKNTVTVTYGMQDDRGTPSSFLAMSKFNSEVWRQGNAANGLRTKFDTIIFGDQHIYGQRIPSDFTIDFEAFQDGVIDQPAGPGEGWTVEWTLSLDTDQAKAFAAQKAITRGVDGKIE